MRTWSKGLLVGTFVVVSIVTASAAPAAPVTASMAQTYGRYRLSNGCELRTLPDGEYVYKTADGRETWGTDCAKQIAALAAAGVTCELVHKPYKVNDEPRNLVDPRTLGYEPGVYRFSDGGLVRILPNGRYVRWNPQAGVTAVGTDLAAALDRWLNVRKVTLQFDRPIETAAAGSTVVAPPVPANAAPTPTGGGNTALGGRDDQASTVAAGGANQLASLVQQLTALVTRLTLLVERLLTGTATGTARRPELLTAERIRQLQQEVSDDEGAEVEDDDEEEDTETDLERTDPVGVSETIPVLAD